MDERPEALLKSALEKIVYFEARSEQLQNDVRAAMAEAERHREEALASAQREIELRQHVAELEVKLHRLQSQLGEQVRLNEVLRLERTDLIGKLVDASRLEKAALAEGNDDAFNLASFISELRSHAQAQTSISEVQTVSVASRAASLRVGSITEQAQRLRSEGRLEVSAQNLVDLASPQGADKNQADDSLLGFSLRELTSKDAHTRIRAAERLKALGQVACAPALATALHAETEPTVQVALLAAFSQVAAHEGVAIVTPLLESSSSEVRMSALKALLKLDAVAAGPYLAQAVNDNDAWVRRRASLLALSLSGNEALRLGEHAISDDNTEVRALAALVLGASAKPEARALLQKALRDGEKKVRQAAAQSLSRLLGENVAPVVDMDDIQRRREVRRIAALPVRETAVSLPVMVAPVPKAIPAVTPRLDEKGVSACMTELRMAIRGRSLHDLAARAKLSVEEAEASLSLLLARGQVVLRGMKYFAA